jgi:hypothetical protein
MTLMTIDSGDSSLTCNYRLPSASRSPRWRVLYRCLLVIWVVVPIESRSTFTYSVLTHEQIVDLLWADQIQPLLLKRYAGLSQEQLDEAHAYAYGGSVIQDLGYYPFGSADFSNLVHYVRSGDFVRELLLKSQDANEYAFAIGALAHYASDMAGHPAVNKAVAIAYPKLGAKFGGAVRYAQGKSAHLKTEFGFDMVQVAKNRYTSRQYHDFIGFRVSKPLLERVFPIVYGVDLKDVLVNEDLAVGSYRFAVSKVIPTMTHVALQTHKKKLMQETPSFEREKFLYRLSRSDYEREWGKQYTKPGFGTRLLSLLLGHIPKIGLFRGLAFKNPTPQTEELYFKSLNRALDHYRVFVEQAGRDLLHFVNSDLDTGQETKPAEYSLTDDTYARLLAKLEKRKFDPVTPALRKDILRFYSDLSSPIETKKHKARWQNLLRGLDQLKAATMLAGAPAQ